MFAHTALTFTYDLITRSVVGRKIPGIAACCNVKALPAILTTVSVVLEAGFSGPPATFDRLRAKDYFSSPTPIDLMEVAIDGRGAVKPGIYRYPKEKSTSGQSLI